MSDKKPPVFNHDIPEPNGRAIKEIKIGDTILVEGHEYIIVAYDIKAASNGRSCSLTSLDPLLAETERLRDEEHRQAKQEYRDMIKQHLDDHNH